MAEARYRAAFVAKLSDAESEAAETQVWLDFALKFGYLSSEEHAGWQRMYEQILAELVRMIDNPEVWLIRSAK